MPSRLIAGVMSGTSADGVDVALVRVEGEGLGMKATLVGRHYRTYSEELRRAIFEIRSGGTRNFPPPLVRRGRAGVGADDSQGKFDSSKKSRRSLPPPRSSPGVPGEEGNARAEGNAQAGGEALTLAKLAAVGREISLSYAAAVNECLLAGGFKSYDLSAVAAHGQTLYHAPPDTIQWIDPALLAAEVGAVVVSDFRRADCAAGGQGAPLVPLADFILFGDAKKNRVVLNIGGIANFTYLPAGGGIGDLIAFDAGPGNCISDDLMRGVGKGWDEGGMRTAEGVAIEAMVRKVLEADYFAAKPPKSTDGPAMLKLFAEARSEIAPDTGVADLLRTACAISAGAIVKAMEKFLPGRAEELIVSGGGVENKTLMGLIQHSLGTHTMMLSTDELGVCGQAKEAIAFALLGAATLDGVPGNVPAATGARRAVVLGAITPKP